jgi:PAP2 superfamily protein
MPASGPIPTINRRTFLRRTGVFAAAAASPSLLLAPPVAAQTQDVGAAFAEEWMRRLHAAVKREGLAPPIAARVYAYVAVAMYEGAVPGNRSLRSLRGRLNGLTSIPKPSQGTASYDWPAVAAAAAGWACAGILDNASDATVQDCLALAEDQARRRLAAGVPASTLERSTLYGRDIAEAVLAWSGSDGYADTRGRPYAPPTGPGLWVPTPPAFVAAPLEPYWGTLRPFFLGPVSEADSPRPDPYKKEARAVYDVSRNLTEEQKAIAYFWADGPGATGTPAGHWVLIACQMVTQLGLAMDRAVELFVKLNVAMGDAFISCWRVKYIHNLLRPVTAIRQLIDPVWLPLLTTPPFPEYTSGHSVCSGAAGHVMTTLLGTFAFTDTTHGTAFPPRTFASFNAAALEAADSRFYGGIHYPMAITRGNDQGTLIGRLAVQRLRTR